MMDKDNLPNCTVIVNEGSGCLFQPASDDYSYVLTAKHVLKEINKITQQTLNDDGTIKNKDVETIGTPFLHSDEQIDACIIKIPRIKGVDYLLRETSLLKDETYCVCGHPNSRIDRDFRFRSNDIKIEQRQHLNYIEGRLIDSGLYHEVAGQSGGGVIRIEGNYAFLAGIQIRMVAEDEAEALGRIEFAPLSFFDSIINENSEDLAPLFPPYIKSFAILTDAVFELKSLRLKKEVIQKELRYIAEKLCEDFSPEKLREKLEDSFFVNSSETRIIEHKELWVSFLELLTYSQLHLDEKMTMDGLIEILSHRKLLFVDSDDWTKKLEEIYSSNLKPLKKGGTIVVKASREEVPAKLEYSPEELPYYDISMPPWQEMNIASTINDIFQDLKLINIFKLQSYIIDNALQYREATNSNIRELLKQNTKDVI